LSDNKGNKFESETKTRDIQLGWDVFITPGIPIVMNDLAPGTKEAFWQPTSSTLIYGRRDAVLVDVPTTWQQGVTLGYWVKDSGKNLTTIYVTHGHGDHFFGIAPLLDRFPNAKVVAIPAVVKTMQRHASPDFAKFWNGLFPGQIPNQLVIAEELKGDTIDLEEHDLRAVELGHTDSDDTSCLHIPSLELVVAGDAVYNGPHQYLADSTTPQKRKDWISALDKIESFNPRTVIAGHKQPGTDNNPRIIEETRQYIRDFESVAEKTATAKELYEGMLKLYPDRLNPLILWLSALSFKGGAGQ
jgi:glyoxylase-like metal-dependent hydrolase (beta-lactamase superfamily II)